MEEIKQKYLKFIYDQDNKYKKLVDKVLESKHNKQLEHMNIYEALDFFIIDEPWHKQRYLGTFNYIKEKLNSNKELEVLDVGYPSNFGLLLLSIS